MNTKVPFYTFWYSFCFCRATVGSFKKRKIKRTRITHGVCKTVCHHIMIPPPLFLVAVSLLTAPLSTTAQSRDADVNSKPIMHSHVWRESIQ